HGRGRLRLSGPRLSPRRRCAEPRFPRGSGHRDDRDHVLHRGHPPCRYRGDHSQPATQAVFDLMGARSQDLIGAGTQEAVAAPDPLQISEPRILTRILSSKSGKVGVALILLLIAVALIGPFVRPHDPSQIVGPPYQSPSGGAPLGTDGLGRDVLSRVLSG